MVITYIEFKANMGYERLSQTKQNQKANIGAADVAQW